MRKLARSLSVMCLVALALALASPLAAKSGSVVGTQAPEWRVHHWINSRPLTLEQLRGKVVLVRWWTAPDCPFCAATAPALNDFHDRFATQGLRVLGFYHHKASSPLEVTDVERYAKLFKFRFPVAIDPLWGTLRAWWLTEKREFTSVSFLLDRAGVVRYVHPGGQYVKGDPQHTKLEATIQQLLAE